MSVVKLGFVPLLDSAPLLVAQANGYFAQEGLEVALSREVSWATVRDKVAVAALDGAHMLAPLALAAGVGSDNAPIIAPLALNRGGAAITLSSRLREALGEGDPAVALGRLIARRREQGASQLTLAVVFPQSTHNYVLRRWLEAAGLDPATDVRLTVSPPPRMADLLAEGVIEGFCAGEPWNTAAEFRGVGAVVARAEPGLPDKVLGVRRDWAEAHPQALAGLVRSLSRAAEWADAPENRTQLAELLATPEHLDLPSGLILSALRHLVFAAGGANRPTVEDGVRLLTEMIRCGQVGDVDAAAAAAEVFRPDLFDAALRSDA